MDKTKIEFNPSHFAPYKWTGSLIITSANWIVNILTISSILPLIDLLFPKEIRADILWIRELYVILTLLLPTLLLFSLEATCFWLPLIGGIGLLNVLSAILRDVIVAPQNNRDIIRVRNRLRWMLIAMLQACAIIICFAVLLLYYGPSFSPNIPDRITALYQSALTFTTLGYGDIRPITNEGKILVILELLFFFLFIGIKLPIAASVIRVKSFTEVNKG